jgi:hypothetical protein
MSILKKLPNASESVKRLNADLLACFEAHGKTRRPKLECGSGDGALAKGKTKEGNSRRFLVRVTSYRRRLLDEDNLCEKYHVDLCRYAGCVPTDAPGQTKIEVSQIKVKTKEEERTEVVVDEIVLRGTNLG